MKSEIKGPRIGPLQKMPRGKHKGKDVSWVIENDTMEFMIAVKEYLQVTRDQAKLFKKVTRGGELPKEYIFYVQKKVIKEVFKEEEEAPEFTEGMNYIKWLQGKDIEEDKSFL